MIGNNSFYCFYWHIVNFKVLLKLYSVNKLIHLHNETMYTSLVKRQTVKNTR